MNLHPELRLLGQQRGPKPQGGIALARKGFRPFFLMAAAHAVLAIPVWLWMLQGKLAVASAFAPTTWHAHEMLFGYTAAVIAGFLLTAASRWTERETATGAPLLALAALWLAGRVAMATALPAPWVALIDVSFLPAIAVAVGRPIVLSGSYRNLGLVVMLLALSAANLFTHLDALGVTPGRARPALLFGTNVIVLMMLLIGGRVIPMFTRNATRESWIHSRPRLDRAALAATLLAAVAELVSGASSITAVLSTVAAVLVVARASTWGARPSVRDPMLWVLHAGHAWIAAGLLLRALSFLLPALGSAALHAFTAGAIGTLTLGMMARVTLGHTGRLIAAAPITGWSFALISAAATVRVVAPLFPEHYVFLLTLSGVSWTVAFVLYLLQYAMVLIRPRADGLPG